MIEWLGLGAYAPQFGLALIAAMLVAFATERRPPEVVAITGMAGALVLGLIDSAEMLHSLSNSAPWTILAMFILTAALARTGLLEQVGRGLGRISNFGMLPLIGGFVLFNIIASALFNNIPQVVMMIPITIALSKACNFAPSRLLMPLSYATILGGTLAMIGASTNLVVDGMAQRAGLPPFGIFDITPVGVIVAIAGGLYLLVAARFFMPDRSTATSLAEARGRSQFLVEVLIPHDSPYLGLSVDLVPFFSGNDREVIDVVRGDASLRREMGDVRLSVGDIVVLKSPVANVLTLRDKRGMNWGGAADDDFEPVAVRSNRVIEAIVGPHSRLLGRTLRNERLRRRYGVYPIALHRYDEDLQERLEDIPLALGDTILIEGAPDDLGRLAEDAGLINLAEPREQGLRLRMAPVALGAFASVILLSAFEILPIAAAGWIAVALVLVARCIDVEEAFASVEWRVLTLIYAMLTVGRALENSGALTYVVDLLLPWFRGWPPIAVLAAIYACASLLTEIVTANAVAVIMTPIAISVARMLGLDPAAFAVAVMFAASASFSTPVGYQTNTLVYAAGGYRFTDFVKIGVPLNIIVGVASVLSIAWFWALV